MWRHEIPKMCVTPGRENVRDMGKICLAIFGFCCSSVLSQKIKSSLEETTHKSSKNCLSPLKNTDFHRR